MTKPKTTAPEIKVVHQDYQPSRQELLDDLRPKGTFKDGIKALVRPVQLRRVMPKRRR